VSATTIRIARTWAIVLAVGLGSPPALASASPVHARARVDASVLEVRVEPATLDAELDRARVEERGRSVLERRVAGLELGERIVVELAGDGHGYRVSVRAFRNGLPILDQPASFEHEGAIDMLLIRVEARIEGAVNRLVTERERQARLQMPSAESQSDAETTPRRRLRLRIPGALAAGLGASMMAGGALLTARGDQPAGNDMLTPTDLRPPGAVLMATGATLLVTGVSLLVVDRVRCRKHRASCDDMRPTLRWMT
jgi:hypothetical protein